MSKMFTRNAFIHIVEALLEIVTVETYFTFQTDVDSEINPEVWRMVL